MQMHYLKLFANRYRRGGGGGDTVIIRGEHTKHPPSWADLSIPTLHSFPMAVLELLQTQFPYDCSDSSCQSSEVRSLVHLLGVVTCGLLLEMPLLALETTCMFGR